jgi:hypothetical protein
MSTVAPPPPPTKRGLPGPFVGLCVLIGVLVGAYAVLTLLSVSTASTEHRTRVFGAVGDLRVDAGSGDVEVVGERRRDIRVDMEIQRGMWRGAWHPHVELQPDGRSLRLRSDCSVWAHIGVSDCGASFTVRVPRSTRVAVDVSSGDVTVRELDGAVVVDASSGEVRAENLRGPLQVEASSGDVDVAGFRGDRVSAKASSGEVKVSATRPPRLLRAEASSGDVTIVVPDVVYRVTVDTSSGDQNVLVQQDFDARRTIDAKASSGDVTVIRRGDEN